ncbi:hypothetical protein GGE50_002551 [Rhizobium leguminosarum]|jgi:hypothetical protein|nr:hypothetical protein [Rhizobium leguminosarum]MBB4342262.1 hypothetical protein [Rhizobium leguminosarum]MBB4354054.1 hypothetical protein [Rhizobium leguminosarum]MBB4387828.1 hypothetical protein [Rhizobium leguminosarum]MBB4468236.1 hypothetical protein [Rhizobium leguminosarum]
MHKLVRKIRAGWEGARSLGWTTVHARDVKTTE